MKVLVATSVVALFLAVLLMWRTPMITRGVYRFAFVLGVAALGFFLFFPRSGANSFVLHTGHGPMARLALLPLFFVSITPPVLVLEVGVAGYRGFSSFLRCACLALAILGLVGLIATLVIPRLLHS